MDNPSTHAFEDCSLCYCPLQDDEAYETILLADKKVLVHTKCANEMTEKRDRDVERESKTNDDGEGQ